MKKITIIFLSFFVLTGCNNKEIKEEINQTNTTTTTITKSSYTDLNPIRLAFYLYHNQLTDRVLITEYTANWSDNTDICSLEVFYTNEQFISGLPFQQIWYNYYNYYDKHQNIDKYKIGYHINFVINNETTIDQNILSPNDTDNLFNYLQIYLYDDIHQEIGKWYSHVTNDEYNDNTLLTSIKLTNGDFTDQITSDITLTVFTYDEDDFDTNNNYRGSSSYTIKIKRI